MSLPVNMNHVTVSEGRLPKKIGECLVDDDMGYKVGDTITLKSGTDDPISDTLKQEKYKVVGIGNSPCYISFGRGSTTIGSGSVSGFLFVPAKTFALDVFTEVYVQVEGAENLIAYTEEYDKKIETVLDRIEEITGERGRIRKQEIVDDAQAEIDDAKAELEAVSYTHLYMGKDRSLTGEAINITILDTFVALMAGFIIIPACFAFNIQPDAGPNLIFITIPNLFAQMPGGRWWGALRCV